MARATFNVSSDWGSGFEARVTVENLTNETLKDWELTFEMPRSVKSIWSARVVSQTGNAYRFNADTFSWNRDIRPGGSVSFGFIGSSGNFKQAPIGFSFSSGGATPNPTPTPVPTPVPTPSPTPNQRQSRHPTPTPTPTPDPTPTPGAFNYGEVLQKSLYFYETQRSGALPADTRVVWRGDSALGDGSDVGVDLSGGYYDAGDHAKFALPMFSSLTMLAWGGIEYPNGFGSQRDELLAAVRWGTDWILKANPAPNVLYGQVGKVSLDHSYWGPAETMTMARPAYAITAQKPGTEVAGEAAASLAAASILFQLDDPTYSATLLTRARELYRFADQYRGTYTDAIPDAAGVYNSYSGYFDELMWAAVWLHRATGEASYLQAAEAIYAQNFNGVTPRWTHNWDDKGYGAVLLLAQLTGKPVYRAITERWLNYWTSGDNGARITRTPGGLAWLAQWGSLRYATTTAFLAGVYADRVGDVGTRYADFAKRQVDYALGDNPVGRSYVVGFGNNPPINPHHRGAHGSWADSIESPVNNRHILYGALVGGPSSASDTAYVDDRTNYITNEVALDYNAGFTGALARLRQIHGGEPLANFPPTELPDDEFFVEARINQQGSTFTEIRALLNNRSAFPAGASDYLSFRYYLDLSELLAAGYRPSDLVVTTGYSQGAAVTGPIVHDAARNLYYLNVDFSGTTLSPGSSSTFRKEVQFRVAAPAAAAWNPANDPSFSGLVSAEVRRTDAMPVFQLGERLEGVVP